MLVGALLIYKTNQSHKCWFVETLNEIIKLKFIFNILKKIIKPDWAQICFG